VLLEQITWGKADSQTPGVYNLKDCAGRCIFYLEVLNLGSLAGLQKICEPLKISAELVCACACTLVLSLSYSLFPPLSFLVVFEQDFVRQSESK